MSVITRDFKKKLKAHGIARFKREVGSYEMWEPSVGDQSATILRHDEMNISKETM